MIDSFGGPVRESNPCRRREREAIYRNSKEVAAWNSTVIVIGDQSNSEVAPDCRAIEGLGNSSPARASMAIGGGLYKGIGGHYWISHRDYFTLTASVS